MASFLMAGGAVFKGRSGGVGRAVGYWTIVVLLFGALGAAAGRLVTSDLETAGPPGPLAIGKHQVDLTRPARGEALRIAREFSGGEIKLFYGEFERTVSRDRLGLRLDVDEAVALIEAWSDPGSLLRRYRDSSGVTGPVAVPVPVELEFAVTSRALSTLKEELDRVAADASIDLETKRIVPEKVGRRLNVCSTAADLEWAARAESEELELSVFEVHPRVRREKLEGVELENVIGWFKTPYSQMHKDRHRTYNLALAAKALNGQILMPGEIFSFNDIVGERSEANGYRVAPVIASGELVDGMGGGTCQIAGTVHAAAFFAGLEIVEREPHSRPSSYIRVGLDATVSYPNIDLKLRNPFPFPVVLGTKVADGWVHADFLGPKRELTITYIRTLMETKEPPTHTIQDDSMPRGMKVTQQRGVPGYLVRRWRIFQKGDVQWRNEGLDRYPPTPHVIKVGTNPALDSTEELHELREPVSEACNMRITQGPDIFEEQTACR